MKFSDKFSVVPYIIGVFIPVPSIGIDLSFLIGLLFHARYMIPAMDCFWIVFSHLLSKSFSNFKTFASIFILFFNNWNFRHFCSNTVHNWDVRTSQIEGDYISNVGNGNRVVINEVNMQSPLFYYASNNTYLTLGDYMEENVSYYVDINDDILKDMNVVYKEIPTNEPTIGYRIYKIDYDA